MRTPCARQPAISAPASARPPTHSPLSSTSPPPDQLTSVGQWLAHRLGEIAEGGRVEGRGVERAAVGGTAGQVGLVVGEGQHAARGVASSGGAEAQRRLRLEEARGLRGGGDEGLEQRRVGAAERERAQVGERLLGRVRQLQVTHVVVVGQPGDAAGDCRGASEAVRALEQQHRAALAELDGGADGGAQAGRARSDDDDVRGQLARHAAIVPARRDTIARTVTTGQSRPDNRRAIRAQPRGGVMQQPYRYPDPDSKSARMFARARGVLANGYSRVVASAPGRGRTCSTRARRRARG